MKITVLAKANGKVEKVDKNDEGDFVVWVKEKPVMGRANQAIVKALAKHFKVPTYAVRIVAGERAKRKIVEISI